MSGREVLDDGILGHGPQNVRLEFFAGLEVGETDDDPVSFHRRGARAGGYRDHGPFVLPAGDDGMEDARA